MVYPCGTPAGPLSLRSKQHSQNRLRTPVSASSSSSLSRTPDCYIYISNRRKTEILYMGSVIGKRHSKEEIEMALAKAKEIVSSNPAVVFSKTYCGYCQRVKQLFSQLKATYKTIELDQESDGAEIQSALKEWTGQTTVPNVFIGGKHIGGCDSVMEMHQQGKLVALLKEAGAIAEVSTQL